MGDFPLMTPNGTFVINGAERVVVSQLVRSPGVFRGYLFDDKGTAEIMKQDGWLATGDIVELRGGDEIAVVGFKSKMNTVSDVVLSGLQEAIGRAEKEFAGLVIWQHKEPFSARQWSGHRSGNASTQGNLSLSLHLSGKAGAPPPAASQFMMGDGSIRGDGRAFIMPDPAIVVFCFNRCAVATASTGPLFQTPRERPPSVAPHPTMNHVP